MCVFSRERARFPGPYIPKYPEEDIVTVQAYVQQGVPNILHVTITFAAPTPPPSPSVGVWVTRFDGSAEVVLAAITLMAPPKNTHTISISLADGGPVDIAVYALLGAGDTDRWPNTGFQRITSLGGTFYDYDSVGGVVVPTNILTMLAPYLAVIGLVATAVMAFKRKRIC